MKFLTDTCLTAQDYYKEHLQYFKILAHRLDTVVAKWSRSL